MFKKGKNGGLYSTSFSAGENQITAEKTMLRIVGSHGQKPIGMKNAVKTGIEKDHMENLIGFNPLPSTRNNS